MAAMDYSSSQHPPPDRKPSTHMGDDELAVLDDNILDSSSPQLSPAMKVRSGSFSETAPSFSSSDGAAWPGFPFSIENCAADSSSNAAQSFLHPSTSATFAQAVPSQSASFSPQSSWQINASSGSCTPTPGYDQPIEFQGNRPSSFGYQGSQGPQMATYDGLPLHSGHAYQSSAGLPTSPQSSKGGWVSSTSSDGMEFRNLPANESPQSPSFSGSTHIMRRDGIRKKNARFEIPAERNLRTIDQLINSTNDEQQIKELKQQKRLLRNRQAALDSRQRKKQHTERLEEEKKHYTSMIGDLEEALSDMKVQEADFLRAKESWATSQQQYQRYVESLAMEKEELVRLHTIETGELRKKNAILVEQMQRMDNTAMSTAPSSTGFSADFSDFDHMNMNNWDDFSIANDFSIEAEPRPEVPLSIVPKKEAEKNVSEDDKAVNSGFLLMLLLVGAWAASRNSHSATDLLPIIPDEMRTASATVLDNIYRDAGIPLHDSSRPAQLRASTPMQGVTQQAPKTTLSAYEIASLSQSSLDSLHHRLVTPSEQQNREQAFSLTPSQYNDLSSTGNYHPSASSRDARNPRSIAEILAGSPGANEGTVAETYTQSLMKDRVSTQVLKDFARMVSQSNMRTTHNQWKSEPVD